jgi:hypothetical protein
MVNDRGRVNASTDQAPLIPVRFDECSIQWVVDLLLRLCRRVRPQLEAR